MPAIVRERVAVAKPVYLGSASGKAGVLLDDFNGGYTFRIYHKGKNRFTDYALRHSDLSIVILDKDAAFYRVWNGNLLLDHSRETLGLKKPRKQ